MDDLRVSIDALAHAKIMHWVHQADNYEVSGMGKVVRLANHLHVVDAFILKQENLPGHTEICSKSLGRALFEHRNEMGDLNFWWHSHSRMEAFFSQTDYDAMKKLGGNGWLLSTVFNAYGDMQTALYMQEPVNALFDNLDTKVIGHLDEATSKRCSQSYNALVTNLKPKKWKKKWKKGHHGFPVAEWEEDKDDDFDWREFMKKDPIPAHKEVAAHVPSDDSRFDGANGGGGCSDSDDHTPGNGIPGPGTHSGPRSIGI